MSENEVFPPEMNIEPEEKERNPLKNTVPGASFGVFKPMELISVLSTWIVISYGAACSIHAAGLQKMHHLQNGYFSVEPCIWIKESLP